MGLVAVGLTFASPGYATYGKGNGLLGFQASPKGCATGARAADLDECSFPAIATAKSDGSGGKKVITGGGQPTFSPTGQSLAYTGSTIGSELEGCASDGQVIETVPSGGGAIKRVSSCKDGFNEEAPTFSPGNTRVAFERRQFAFNQPPPSIASLTLDGKSPLVLATNATQPAWGSKGRLAFVRSGDIWTMNGDGSGQVRLTKAKADDFSPDYSPGASRIAFARSGEIYTMDTNGKGLRRLTHNKTSEGDPVWSPDGNRIAFAVRRKRLDVMKPDGKGRKTVVRNGREPAWQPKR